MSAFLPLPLLTLLKLGRSRLSLLLGGVMLVLAIGLTGCVESDVGVRFDSPSRGEIVQHIELSERLQSLSGDTVAQWLRVIERQATAVGGAVQTESRRAVTIRIPFTSSHELEEKFNQFSTGVFNQNLLPNGTALPRIRSTLQVKHSNFLLVERDRLHYEVDLRSLGVTSAAGEVLLSPTALIRLQFYLETPWGARPVIQAETLRPRSLNGSKRLIWNLIPGEQNSLETVFWMPNTLGIGTVVIVALVLLGTRLKYPTVNRSGLRVNS